MGHYTILKEGCYSEFGCCDELLPYDDCEKDCIYGEKITCGQWMKSGEKIDNGSVSTHCGGEDLFSIINKNTEECIKNGIIK